MKKIICLATALMCLCGVSIAKCTAPENIQKIFNAKFPTAQDVEWSKENSNEYEVEFEIDDQEYSANYSIAGEWLETESPISFDKLPQVVQDAFKNSHPSAEIEAVKMIENSAGKINYEVEIEKWLWTSELYYTSAGIEFKDN